MIKTVYISGPITGHDIEECKVAFGNIQEYLERRGFNVVNPLSENGYDPNKSYEQYMRDDLKLLLDCDYIYLMAGWDNSKGCQAEYLVALTCGISILGD